MAFDKNNTSLGMKIIICFFAFSLVISLCLPFFSGCSTSTTTGVTGAPDPVEQQAYTVAEVQEQYSTLLESLQSKLAADPNNTAAVASLGNNYMDYAMTMEGATDAAENEETIHAAYDEAVKYYDLYLTIVPADDANVAPVTVDRCVCLYYAGETEQAVAELTAFLETQPDYTMGWYNLGAVCYMEGDYEQAKAAFGKVVELDPEAALAQTTYAQLYLSIIDSLLAAQAEAAEEESAAEEGAAEEGAADEADAEEGAADEADAE